MSRLERECFECGKKFEGYPARPRGKRTFCSQECRLKRLGKDNRKKRVNQPGGLTKKERETSCPRVLGQQERG